MILESAYTTVYLIGGAFLVLCIGMALKHRKDKLKQKQKTKERKEKTFSNNKKRRLGID